uniref:Uncharacterized protein n=1 Tax=Panagrolaimus sp. PS1159 TaxID=55785 RepID=A0AC35GAM9_9BILA
MGYFHVVAFCFLTVFTFFLFIWVWIPKDKPEICSAALLSSSGLLSGYNMFYLCLPIIMLWVIKIPPTPLTDNLAEISFTKGVTSLHKTAVAQLPQNAQPQNVPYYTNQQYSNNQQNYPNQQYPTNQQYFGNPQYTINQHNYYPSQQYPHCQQRDQWE